MILGFALVGCGAQPTAQPSPSSTVPVPGAGCPAVQAAGRTVAFGHELRGIVLGTGRTGVVLAHEASADLCYYAAVATELVAKGYRVLAFDFNGNGSSGLTGRPFETDAVEAADFLRADGATGIVLVGASMGGTAVLVAATQVTTPVAAVISLSAPFGMSGMLESALNTAPKLTVPVLYLCGTGDARFAEAAQLLSDATTQSPDRKLVLVNDNGHGVRLINPGTNEVARTAFADFLAAHAPA
ncbi:pimeloyl-ACP methyl ester carboxylesterase [Allocatelliglobosispora scoriae]|uniref:Pimeloyl-ACP methyl ester carboxylesterase n=1 Tax=Allocatelliglobosispora scoriae TaxID=643052 RepID=A0A841C2V0_9ACTN|nr:alpha/beta hydrolase [Allocatelliglobosispora scoriae]MBB5873171.1 pimeloyl-ACP methyl ester carboxylesterase [Allocatelliglobosispora scoriae]